MTIHSEHYQIVRAFISKFIQFEKAEIAASPVRFAVAVNLARHLLHEEWPPQDIAIPMHGKPKKIGGRIEHIVRYFLWTLKWFIIRPIIGNKQFVAVSIFPDIASSRNSLEDLSKEARNSGRATIHFGMLPLRQYYLSMDILCFPYAVYREDRTSVDNKLADDLVSEICMSFPVAEVKHIRNDILRLSCFSRTIDRYVTQFSKRNRIHFYLSDADGLDTRSLLAFYFRSQGVPTIRIDHALTPHRSLIPEIISTQYWCWGKFHQESVQKRGSTVVSAPTIRIIGHPERYFVSRHYAPGRRWLYYLPSFYHPMTFVEGRGLNRTMDMVKEIANIAQTPDRSALLYVKPHPTDDANLLPFPIASADIVEKLEGVGLVFVEDSSIIANVIQYDIPIIYIADGTGNDSFKVEELGIASVVRNVNTLQATIENAHIIAVDIQKRQAAFKYYFSEHNNARQNYRSAIQTMLGPSV